MMISWTQSLAHKLCSCSHSKHIQDLEPSLPFLRFKGAVVVIQRPVTSELDLNSCLNDVEASKVTFLSLLNPDSAVGAVSSPSAALQV